MSSAMNHRKRSHRSEGRKDGAFRSASRRAYYRNASDQQNAGVLRSIARLFHRKDLFKTKKREETADV